jgi:hypothetical protein
MSQDMDPMLVTLTRPKYMPTAPMKLTDPCSWSARLAGALAGGP